MTYMPETNLSSAPQEAPQKAGPSTFDKLKTLTKEGSARTQRISQILRQAFSETREEFQAGRTVISPLAKEVTNEAVSTFKSKSQEAAEAVNQAWQSEANAPDTTERLINSIKSLFARAKTTIFPIVQKQAKQQAIRLDEVLSDRYSTQYLTLKERFNLVRSWAGTNPIVEKEPTTTGVDHNQQIHTEQHATIQVDSETVG
ncbi:MAG: hypothetical protein AAFQ63_12950 [Cyanobacteria bacterium J06621_11]